MDERLDGIKVMCTLHKWVGLYAWGCQSSLCCLVISSGWFALVFSSPSFCSSYELMLCFLAVLLALGVPYTQLFIAFGCL